MSNKRQTIIDAATRLFNAHGYRAIGIGRVVAEADVAKMTLYKHFPSKNDLILSVLHDWDGKFRKRLLSFVDGFRVPKERLAAFFSWHDRWFREPDFNGCMFISAAAEYPDNQDPIHCASMGHKRAMRGHIGTLLRDLAGSRVDTCTVDQVAQILDGAIVAAHLLDDKDAAVACSAPRAPWKRTDCRWRMSASCGTNRPRPSASAMRSIAPGTADGIAQAGFVHANEPLKGPRTFARVH